MRFVQIFVSSLGQLIDNSGFQLSDWDRFAAEEYELLVAEEGNNEPMDDM